jgi:hypothetical protein
MYIPEADATLGGTFRLRSSGLKIEPPPKPKAPATKPPSNEKTRMKARLLPLRSITPSASPPPYLRLMSYSYYSQRTLYAVMPKQIAKKIPSDDQSLAEQTSTPNTEGVLLDPRHRFTNASNTNTTRFFACFVY